MNDPEKQLDLIEPDDDALLLTREEAAKLYTARSAEKLEKWRDCILGLLGAGYPIESVAAKAHCSKRIVSLLGGKYAQTVASNNQEIVKVVRGLCMKAAFLINDKMADAKISDLIALMSYGLQRSMELELAGSTIGELAEKTIDIETDNPALRSARQFLESRRAKATEATIDLRPT